MPAMKKHNTDGDFYFSKNKNSFWVRNVMAGMQLNISKQGDMQPFTYVAIFSKTLQNTL